MNKSNWIETIVYGLLSLLFAAAFFFGTLFPEYGLSYAVRSSENTKEQEAAYEHSNTTGENIEDIKKMQYPGMDYDRSAYKKMDSRELSIEDIQRLLEEGQVEYRCYLYDRIRDLMQ